MTVDTHAHVYKRGLPLAEVRRYAPDYDADVGTYLTTLDRYGIEKGVLVQPSFLGTDNGFMLAALHSAPGRLRAIAVVDPATSLTKLIELDAAGVVGVRLNLLEMPVPDFTANPWPDFLAYIKRLDWQIEVQRNASDLAAVISPLVEAGMKVVVDHFGRPDPLLGVRDPGFAAFLDLAQSRQVWVKLSAPYRLGKGTQGESNVLSATRILREAFGVERLLWGSDWPHTQHESPLHYQQALRLFEQSLPKRDERETILADNPIRLFHFHKSLPFNVPSEQISERACD